MTETVRADAREPADDATTRWARVRALFAAALEAPLDARPALLASAAATDPALASEVASLLAAHDADGAFLEVSAVDAASRFVPDAGAARLGQLVGPYRLVHEVGRGGMGVVYAAERDDAAYRKRVAVKLIKRGMDTDAVVRRFRHERQILATLDHPNVARLLDGGATADGLPYFVMEYVDGEAIDAFCAARGLSLGDRLRLFRRVCAAVHFAHQHLVIHRDLKPGNILVTADGTPKLLDFGLARLLGADGSGGTDSTLAAASVRAMTPEYASPEQLRGEPLNTLTDVYSLGVLLHELVTGERPYRVSSRDPEVVARAIAERAPDTSAGARAALRGDLATVVARATHAEPARRYVSAEQLGEEVTRYLERRPLLARPDTWSYRARQFVRRNRAGVAAASLVVASLVGGLGVAAWQARVARQQRATAEARFADVRRLAGALLFELDDAIEPLAGSTHARELVVRRSLEYLDRLARSTVTDGATAADASLQRELGAAYERVGRIQGNSYYRNLGQTAGAMTSYRKSLAIRQRLAALAPADRAVQAELADAYEGVGDLQSTADSALEARRSYERALAIRERLASGGPADASLSAALGHSYTRLGDVVGLEGIESLGDLPGARRYYGRAVALYDSLVAATPHDSTVHHALGAALSNAGLLARTAGDLPAAAADGRRAVAELERLAAEHPGNANYRYELLAAYNNLRFALVDQGLLSEAVANSRKAIPLLDALADADPHNVTAKRDLSIALGSLGRDLLQGGDAAGALAVDRRALGIVDALSAADRRDAERLRDLAFTLRLVGDATAATGDRTGALATYRRAADVERQKIGARPMTDRDRDDLSVIDGATARVLAALGRPADALPVAREAVALADAAAGHAATHAGMQTRLARRLYELGTVELTLGERPAACVALDRSRDVWERLRSASKLPFADRRGPDDAARTRARCTGGR